MKSKFSSMPFMSTSASPRRTAHTPLMPACPEVRLSPTGAAFVLFQRDQRPPVSRCRQPKPHGRIAYGGSDIEDVFGLGGKGKRIEEPALHRADDGHVLALSVRFHVGQHAFALRGKTFDVGFYPWVRDAEVFHIGCSMELGQGSRRASKRQCYYKLFADTVSPRGGRFTIDLVIIEHRAVVGPASWVSR